jgi:hypothetical protein
MDGIYKAILSSSRTLLEQVGCLLQAEQADFGPFWALLDERGNVCAGDAGRLAEFIPDFEQVRRCCAQVDDGFEPAICPAKDAVAVVGQFCTEHTHCGYMMLVLPGYTLDTAQANIGIIEIALNQLNLLVGMIEKNNQLHQEQLNRLSKQSPVFSNR